MAEDEDRLFYGSVQNDGIRLQYYRTGGEKPPLVFIHGYTDNGLCWSRLPLFLRHTYDVVMYDARGHGISDHPEGSTYSLAERAEDAIAVIEGLSLQRPVLIGHSMGADTAARVAADHPKTIRGLVLIDPPWFPQGWNFSTEVLEERAQKSRESILRWHSQTLDEVIELCREKHPQWDEAEYFQWAKAKKQVRPEAASVITQPREDWWDMLKRITCPVLLATANVEAGGLVTDEVAEEAVQLCKTLERVHFEQAGHSIHREEFYALRDAVRTFLRRLKS
jgi:pimeloyl-ACP methyl ester carboxylesterase